LNKMKRLDQHQQPDKISYSSVIHSLANHGMAEEAEALLHEMEERSRHNCSYMNVNSCMRPDGVTYNLVVRAWAKNQNPKKAEAILRRMEQQHDDLKPDATTYNCILHAWANCNHDNNNDHHERAAKCAETILAYMEYQYHVNGVVEDARDR